VHQFYMYFEGLKVTVCECVHEGGVVFSESCGYNSVIRIPFLVCTVVLIFFSKILFS
jgi:hypothetical protein